MRIDLVGYRVVGALVGTAAVLGLASMAAAQSPAKFEPPDGVVYHGAFPVGQHSTNPGDYYLDTATFENLAGKHLAIVLGYANWSGGSSSFQNGVGGFTRCMSGTNHPADPDCAR